jgi:hypothetical protein
MSALAHNTSRSSSALSKETEPSSDLAGLCVVAVAAFVTRSRVNRLEFGNERSDEIA